MGPKDTDLINWLNNLDAEEKKSLLELIGMTEPVTEIEPTKLELLEAALALLPGYTTGSSNRIQ